MGFFGSKNVTKCKECGTELPTAERLQRHKEIAHNKKKEKCRVCGNEFDSESDLKKHKRKCK